MAKLTVGLGAALILVGVLLGFVKSGECGSVFDPRSTEHDAANRIWAEMHNDPSLGPPDCSQALDLTVPVWILIGVGVALSVAGGIGWSRQRTAESQEAIPAGNDVP